jgi:single-stranded DNA-binding protein
VLVIGRLEISEWETREGETRTSYDIWADDLVNLSPREDGGVTRPAGGYSSAPAQTAGVGAAAGHGDEATELDELPF